MTTNLLFLVVVSTLAASCEQPDKSNFDEKQLTKKLLESIEKRISTGKIESFVGKKATINTTRKGDRNSLELVNIGIDRKRSQIDTLDDATDLVYWVYSSVEKSDPQIVGVVWTKKNEMKLFFGDVMPR